jgi:hypothetical protein
MPPLSLLGNISLESRRQSAYSATLSARVNRGVRRDDENRGVLGIVVGHDHCSKDAIRVYVIGTSSFIHTNRFEPMQATRELIDHMNVLHSQDPAIIEENPEISATSSDHTDLPTHPLEQVTRAQSLDTQDLLGAECDDDTTKNVDNSLLPAAKMPELTTPDGTSTIEPDTLTR